MNVLAERSSSPITLRAPGAGIVCFHAPRALCGELEVFETGETIADIDGALVVAPARGFIVQRLAGNGTVVDDATVLAVFRSA